MSIRTLKDNCVSHTARVTDARKKKLLRWNRIHFSISRKVQRTTRISIESQRLKSLVTGAGGEAGDAALKFASLVSVSRAQRHHTAAKCDWPLGDCASDTYSSCPAIRLAPTSFNFFVCQQPVLMRGGFVIDLRRCVRLPMEIEADTDQLILTGVDRFGIYIGLYFHITEIKFRNAHSLLSKK